MNSKKWLLLGLLVMCAVAVFLLRKSAGNGGEIKLGAIFPMTGDIASYGKAAQQGIDLAVKEVNARGGVGGKKVRVVFEDDQGQTSAAVAAFHKLTGVDGAVAVFGSAASSVTLALCPLAIQAKVPLLTPISSSPELTEKGGRFFFRVCPPDTAQAGMMADWLKEDARGSVAVIYVNNSWGQSLVAEFKSRFEGVGGKLALSEGIKEGERDLRGVLAKVKEAAPTALYGVTYGREGGAMLRQASELQLNLPVYGADVWGSPELKDTAGDTVKGVKIIVPAKLQGGGYENFAKAFKAANGSDPDIYASYSYDMALVLLKALESGASGDALRDALAKATLEGVTGFVRFDKKGNPVGKSFERKVF